MLDMQTGVHFGNQTLPPGVHPLGSEQSMHFPRPSRPYLRVATLVVLSMIVGQTPAATLMQDPPRKTRPKDGSVPVKKDKEATRIRRRQDAVELLLTLAHDANRFDDQALRAVTQARVASILWKSNREKALDLYERAWDTAELLHKDRRRRADSEVPSQSPGVAFAPADVRTEIIDLAFESDPKVGEVFLEQLLTAPSGPGAPSTPGQSPLLDPTDGSAERLRIAGHYLQAGKIDTSVAIASPALLAVSINALAYLSKLRLKSPATADALYQDLLRRAAADSNTDANAILVLSTYVFSPNSFMLVGPSGHPYYSEGSNSTAPAELPSALRDEFLASAAGVFLRAQSVEDFNRTSAGRAGTYVIITRLLPFYEQFAIGYAAQLKSRLVSLAVEDSGQFSASTNPYATAGLSPQPKPSAADRIAQELDRARTAAKPRDRDAAFANAALVALSIGDSKAREYGLSIEDGVLRRDVVAYVDFALASRALKQESDLEIALRVARSGELPKLQSAWILVAAATTIAQTKPNIATDLLEEAVQVARRIDLNDSSRPKALFAIAFAIKDIDVNRFRELAVEAISAANKADDFTGESGAIEILLKLPRSGRAERRSVPEFDIGPVLSHVARSDLAEAIYLAKSCKNDRPKANAMLAVATAILSSGSNTGDSRGAGNTGESHREH